MQDKISKCCDKCWGGFEHRVGSHSDDYGGDSDLPCYCNYKCEKPDCLCHSSHITNEHFQERVNKSSPQVPEWKIRFREKFAPKTIWVVPSKENIETINDVEQFISEEISKERDRCVKICLEEGKNLAESAKQEAEREVREKIRNMVMKMETAAVGNCGHEVLISKPDLLTLLK